MILLYSNYKILIFLILIKFTKNILIKLFKYFKHFIFFILIMELTLK